MEVEIEGDFGAVHACLRKENERGHVREHGGHVREPRARPRRTGTKRTGSRTCPLGPADRALPMVSISRQQCKRGRQRKDVEVLTRLGPLQAKGRRIIFGRPKWSQTRILGGFGGHTYIRVRVTLAFRPDCVGIALAFRTDCVGLALAFRPDYVGIGSGPRWHFVRIALELRWDCVGISSRKTLFF